ncbi:MAG TPA: hypothetical protein VJ827_13340 [Rubrobacter sp.]|nr:hypothetical protein [Rubrobacter sp.]
MSRRNHMPGHYDLPFLSGTPVTRINGRAMLDAGDVHNGRPLPTSLT